MNLFRNNKVRVETKWTDIARVEHTVYRGKEVITAFVQTLSVGFSFVTPAHAQEAATMLKKLGKNWKETK